MATETAAERVRDLTMRLLAALDDAQAEARESRGPRATMTQMMAGMHRDDIADEARAALPGLAAAVDAAEAAAGQTARTVAAARVMDASAFDRLETLMQGLGAKMQLKPTPTAIRFLDGIYKNEKKLDQKKDSRHIKGYIQLFVRIAGDKPIAEYTRADIVSWVNTLEKINRTIGKSRTDEHKPISEIIRESRGKPTLNRTTIEKHITHLKAFFLAAHRNFPWCGREHIENMFYKVEMSDTVPQPRKRKPWTDEQLNALLATPIWSGTRSRIDDRTKRHEPGPQIHRDAYWWLPVVALWTGARLEELAQLHHDDLRYDKDGIAFIAIHDDGERSVKDAHSVRDVPVHSFLISLGFLALFRPNGRGRIWPELAKKNRLDTWSALYSTHFADYRKECKLYESLRDFHSFRHTAVSALRRAGVDGLTVAALIGHTNEADDEARRARQTQDYTHYSVATRKEAVERLDYAAQGVEIDILLRTAAVCGPRGSVRVDDLPPRDP